VTDMHAASRGESWRLWHAESACITTPAGVRKVTLIALGPDPWSTVALSPAPVGEERLASGNAPRPPPTFGYSFGISLDIGARSGKCRRMYCTAFFLALSKHGRRSGALPYLETSV